MISKHLTNLYCNSVGAPANHQATITNGELVGILALLIVLESAMESINDRVGDLEEKALHKEKGPTLLV